MVLAKPILSKAVISAFNTADPVCFKIPIPLVAPPAGKFVIESFSVPKAPTLLVILAP